MIIRRTLALLLALLMVAAATAAGVIGAQDAPQGSASTPCGSGATYDPACDVDHDGDVDVLDISSQAPGSSQGFSYSFSDVAVEPGLTYWYWLVDVSLAGVATLHGPVSVTVAAPTAVRVGGFGAEAGGSVMLSGWPVAAEGLAFAAGLVTGALRRRQRLVRGDATS